MVAESYPLLEQHLVAGRLDQAESIAHHLLGIEPGDVTARCALARVALARGQEQRALEALERLIAEAPAAPLALAHLAAALAAAGEEERALELAHASQAGGVHIPVAMNLLAGAAHARGDLDQALDFYARAIEAAAKNADAWYGRGCVLRDLGELVMAEDALVQALQHAPMRVQIWFDLVKLEQDAGAHEVAAENLTLALRALPGHPDLLALKASEEATPSDDFDQVLEALRLSVYEDDHGTATLLLDELVELGPDDLRLAIAKGEVCLLASTPQTIPPLVHELQRLVRADAQAWHARCVLGRLLLRESPLQNTNAAVAFTEEAYRISGEHPHAGIGLIEAWASTQKTAYARALLKRLAAGQGPEAERAFAILHSDLS